MHLGPGRAREEAGSGELGGFRLQFTDGRLAEPGMAVRRVVAGASFILLEETGEIQWPQFPEEDGFRFLVERGWEGHEREAKWSGFCNVTCNCRRCRVAFLRRRS